MYYTIFKFAYNNLGGRGFLIKALDLETFTEYFRIKKVLAFILKINESNVDKFIIDVLDVFFMNRKMKSEFVIKFNELEKYKD